MFDNPRVYTVRKLTKPLQLNTIYAKIKNIKERAVLKTVALIILVKNNHLNLPKFKDGYFLLSFLMLQYMY